MHQQGLTASGIHENEQNITIFFHKIATLLNYGLLPSTLCCGLFVSFLVLGVFFFVGLFLFLPVIESDPQHTKTERMEMLDR